MALAAVRRAGGVSKSPEETPSLLSSYWGEAFTRRDVDSVAADAYLDERAPAFPDLAHLPPPALQSISKALGRAQHSAPGPDVAPCA
eukprot:5540825-Pyramimonas_sp.AAC.1